MAGCGSVCIFTEIIIQTQGGELSVQGVHALLRRKVPAPGVVFIIILHAFANLQQIIQRLVCGSHAKVHRSAADAALFTVQRVNHQKRSLSVRNQFGVFIQIAVHAFFAADFPDKRFIANQPSYIFHETAGRRVIRAQTVTDFVRYRFPFNLMRTYIMHQVIEGDVILYQAVVMGVFDFHLLGDTGTDKRKFIGDPQFFPGINGSAHEGTLYREQFREQFGMIFFDISYHSGTGLGYAAGETVLPDIIDITPGGDIRAERNVDETFDAELFQSAQHLLVFIRIIGLKGRGDQNRNTVALMQVSKKGVCIVTPGTGIVVAGIKARAAGDTTLRIYINPGYAAFIRFGRNTGAYTTAHLNTFVAADTILVCVH